MNIEAIGINSALGHAQTRMGESTTHRVETATKKSESERFVTLNDSDNDGKLNINELRETKLGKRMSVERFAKLDANSDGMLEAKEFDQAEKSKDHRNHSNISMESAVRAKMANYLIAKVESDPASDVAQRVINGLDGDGSGGLNSEEIAGTKLAGLIGDTFFSLDADKSGALDQAELAGYIADRLSDLAHSAIVSEPVSKLEDAAVNDVIEEQATLPEVEENATPSTERNTESSVSEYANRVKSAFETALEILKNNNSGGSYDVVNALFEDVQSIYEVA